MTDRELLELAAKAAGFNEIQYQDMSGWGEVRYGFEQAIWTGSDYWNPLADDGDALRLAVKLKIDICHNHAADHQRWVLAERSECESAFPPVCCVEDDFEESQRMDAARRAIVRAAAEIGKSMP